MQHTWIEDAVGLGLVPNMDVFVIVAVSAVGRVSHCGGKRDKGLRSSIETGVSEQL